MKLYVGSISTKGITCFPHIFMIFNLLSFAKGHRNYKIYSFKFLEKFYKDCMS